METAKVLQTVLIPHPEHSPVDQLRAWDWRAELDRQERGMTWLARKTDRSVSAVYRYALGTLTPPESWLRDVARLLGPRGVAA